MTSTILSARSARQAPARLQRHEHDRTLARRSPTQTAMNTFERYPTVNRPSRRISHGIVSPWTKIENATTAKATTMIS